MKLPMEKAHNTKLVSWRTWRLAFGVWRLAFGVWNLAFGIWLIPFFLIVLDLPDYVRRGIWGAGLGLVICASAPPVTFLKRKFSSAFVGAICLGLVAGFTWAFYDFVENYFGW